MCLILRQKPTSIGTETKMTETVTEMLQRRGAVPSDTTPSTTYTPDQQTEERGGDSSLMGFMNRGIVDTFMAPIDAVNRPKDWLVNQIGGALFDDFEPKTEDASDLATSLLGQIGTDVAPEDAVAETFAERAFEMGGEAAGMAPAILMGGQLMASSANPYVAGAGAAIAEPFTKAPLLSAGTEVGLGMAAGGGGVLAEENAEAMGMEPEDARIYGELFGGLTAAGVVTATAAGTRGILNLAEKTPVAGYVVRLGRSFLTPKTVARNRAEQTARTAAKLNPDASTAATTETVLGITPAQRVGTDEMLALEHALRKQYPDFDAQMRDLEAESMAAGRTEFTGPGEGVSPEEVTQYYQQVEEAFADQIDARLAMAKDNIDTAFAQAGPRTGESRAQLSTKFREELDLAYEDAKTQNNQLWGDIDRTASVDDMEYTENALQSVRDKAGIVNADRIPADIKTFLDPESAKYIGDNPTADDVLGLVSRLRTTAAKLRGPTEGDATAAGWADEVANGLLDDLAEVPDIADAVQTARAYTKSMKDAFERGYLGSVLKSDGRGYDRVAPEETLAKFFGTGKGEGAVVRTGEVDEAFSVADRSPEEAQRTVEEYMRNAFLDTAVTDDTVRIGPAQTFMKGRADFMEKYPAIAEDFDNAIAAARTGKAEEAATAADIKARGDEPQSKFLGARIGDEIKTAMSSQDPVYELSTLSAIAAEDPTGTATLALKSAVGDWLIDRTSKVAVGREPFLSGEEALKVFSDDVQRDALTEVFGPEQMALFDDVVSDLRALSASHAQSGTERAILDQTVVEKLVSFVTRSAAIRMAPMIQSSGAGTIQLPAVMANAADSVVTWLRGAGGEKILKEALLDQSGQKLQTLLDVNSANADAQKRAYRTLVLWSTERAANQELQPQEADDPMQALEDALGVERETTGYTVPDQYNPLRIDIP